MKKLYTISFCTLLAAMTMGQGSFTTVVPRLPIVAGEAFQVQYIAEDGAAATGFVVPVFKGFKTVAGPNVYSGISNAATGFRQTKNFVFTLVALHPGQLVIPGTFVTLNGKQVRSNDHYVKVVSGETTQNPMDKEMLLGSDYYLRPGEDVSEKIRQNIFLRVQVDKRTCYVGEPVQATFKLYSRLESKSDIVKNPGFYGFTVLDVINLDDRLVTSELVNGKPFDVHTVRKVQLYPLQEGVFTIDAMEMRNRIEFSHSQVKRKTEQEIVEGVLHNHEPEVLAGTEIVENDIRTEPVTITVRPAPAKKKPEGYNGATGQFTVVTVLPKEVLAPNEQGLFEVWVAGKGNFIQLNAPVINWPAGVEGFEPVVSDSLDKYSSPLRGRRKFRYAFVAADTGTYIIPPVQFAFFDPDSGVYKELNTPPHSIVITGKKTKTASSFIATGEGNGRLYLLTGVLGFLATGLLLLLARKRAIAKKTKTTITATEKQTFPVQALLQPSMLYGGDKEYYTRIYEFVWRFFSHHLALSGTGMNKANLLTHLRASGVAGLLLEELAGVLQQCETGMFTNAALHENREYFLNGVARLLEQIEPSLL